LAYDAGLVRDYVAAWTSREKLEELVSRHDIGLAIVARPDLVRTFRSLEGWELRSQGPVCEIFQRKH
jgi:hypothetical protein